MKRLKRVITAFVMLAVVFSFMPVIDGQVYAASKAASRKKPAAPKITYAKEVSVPTDETKVVLVKWTRVKGVKKYQVGARSPQKVWYKVKTVKKTAKNKKKYTRKNKFRVVAKGKKYKVYRYGYKYTKLDATKSCQYRFTEAYNWGDIGANSTYLFAVRSMKGKKYSKWKTVAVTTGAGANEEKTLTSPGQSISTTMDGKKVTLTVGKNSTVPMPQPKKGSWEAKPLTIIPSKIEDVLVRDETGNSETINIEGKAPDGREAYCRINIEGGVCDSIYYTIGGGTNYGDDKTYTCEGLGYGPGFCGKKYTVLDPATSVVWTTDGAEPKLGQANKSINGNEYPFDQVTSNSSPYNGSVQVRGTGTYENGGTSIWSELKRALFNKCEWVRIYKGTTIVAESFLYDGYYN